MFPSIHPPRQRQYFNTKSKPQCQYINRPTLLPKAHTLSRTACRARPVLWWLAAWRRLRSTIAFLRVVQERVRYTVYTSLILHTLKLCTTKSFVHRRMPTQSYKTMDYIRPSTKSQKIHLYVYTMPPEFHRYFSQVSEIFHYLQKLITYHTKPRCYSNEIRSTVTKSHRKYISRRYITVIVSVIWQVNV